MPDNGTVNTRDAKLIQWLTEAYTKEAELEADLTAHIALTQKPSYKKRLQRHLTETRDHKRRVTSQIKKLGGDAPSALNLPGVPDAIGEVAGKAVSAVKGQVGAARAAVTSQQETHLRNAQEELREEHVEIALYTRIVTLAEEVGDRETAQLAKSIRRDEERMAKFLDAELVRLVKELVRREIPRDQRAGGRRTRRTSRRRTAASRSTSRRSTSGSRRSSTRSQASSRSGSGSRTNGSGSRTSGGSRAGAGSRANGGSRTRSTSGRSRARAGSRA
jgi:ferritin-like metal-binding protein YciE